MGGELLYRFDPQAIIDGMTAIQKAHNAIDRDLDDLEVKAVTAMALWTGPDGNSARLSYDAHKLGWDANVNAMKEIMTKNAIPALDAILENYQVTERLNANGWRTG